MNMKKISDIKIKDNVRTELGDLTELTASIKANGVLEPLIIDIDNVLISGHRRLEAAKKAGRLTVPVVNTDSDASREEVQLIENMHRKDLTPFEEAQAFSDYMKAKKKDAMFLAKQINKTVDYIKRRLLILKLSQESTHALNDKKIEIGHAVLLAQMDDKQQKEALKNILEHDLTVQNFADQIRWMQKVDFGEIEFRPAEKKQKTLLDGFGVELRPMNEEDDLKRSNTFKKELLQYVESERKKLKDKGITVFSSKSELLKKHSKAVEINTWSSDYNKIVSGLPKSKDYAVVVDFEYSRMDKTVFELSPKPVVEKKEKKVSDEESDKILEKSREEKFKNRIEIYSRNMKLNQTRSLLVPGTKDAKIVTLWALCQNFHPEADFKFKNIEQMKDLTDKELDAAIKHCLDFEVDDMSSNDLNATVDMLGFDAAKHWKLDDEFLKCHDKMGLHKLAEELKVDIEGLQKNGEISDAIKKAWKKGTVPKALQEKKSKK